MFSIGDMTKNKYINNNKTVLKPWGKEIWLELNEKYCYKRIEILSGFKTSFQYHNFKLETIYIIKGDAEVWLENDDGVVETFFMKAGDFFTVLPKRKHRVIAITDVITLEASTPEVDDVIRINDEFNRNDGKIENEHIRPAVCILAAGLGTRLGNISINCHKTLLPVNNKAIISHIIDKFHVDTEIIIAIGHLKEQIKEYISLYHREREHKITFIEVCPYEGAGSGPAQSLDCCREKLQRPFYFCVSDFITDTELENNVFLGSNWIGLYPTTTPELYSTVKIEKNDSSQQMRVVDLMNKSKNGYSDAFTGIFYMYDYKLFWEQFDKHVTETKENVDAFKEISLFNFKIKNIDWIDTGTLDLYNKAVEHYDGKNLYLQNNKNEYKYLCADTFIKKIDDIKKINNIFIRQEYLKKYTPTMLFKGEHFFSYKFVKGETLYTTNNREIYNKFLEWFEYYFIKDNYHNKGDGSSINIATKFYKEKTKDRLNSLKTILKSVKFEELDSISYINNKKVEKIEYYLDHIDWENITNIIPTTLFHGDLHFENSVYCDVIIPSSPSSPPDIDTFKIIDWREDFGGNTVYGDLYYDLAKLYGGMVLNYLLMKNTENYSWEKIDENSIILKHYVDDILIDIANNDFVNILNKYNLDFNRVKTLTALIFLNMSPLHINNFDTFLFFKSKTLFSEIIN